MPESSSMNPETAVREYLMWITDPGQLVDADEVGRLERVAAEAADPIEKLKALSQLERARAVDGERFKVNFIAHAKAWADEHQVSAAAFRELGVDDTILRAAGIGLAAPTRQRRTTGGTGGTGGSGASEPLRGAGRSVSSMQIKSAIAEWDGEFTLADVVTKVGGSPMTVRKAVDDLVEQGVVRRLGPSQQHAGRGRAPIVYRVR